MLGERVPHFGDGAHAVIGHRVDHQRRAADAIALIANLFVSDALQLAGATLNRASELVLGHVAEPRFFEREAQARIHRRIGTAVACGNGDFTNDLGPE